MSEANKALLRRVYDGINKGDLSVIDEIVTVDAIEHAATPPGVQGTAAEVFKQMMGMFLTAFPDLHLTAEDMIAEGDSVASRITITGTHKGEFMGIAPTGKQISFSSMEIVRFAGGKAVEHWEVSDNMSMMQQLGAIPGP